MGTKKDKRLLRPIECCANCNRCYAEMGPGEPHSYYCGLDSEKPKRTAKDFEWLKFKDTEPKKAQALKELYRNEIVAECGWLRDNRIEYEFSVCQYYEQSKQFKKKLKNDVG